jgi:hypothetical protein
VSASRPAFREPTYSRAHKATQRASPPDGVTEGGGCLSGPIAAVTRKNDKREHIQRATRFTPLDSQTALLAAWPVHVKMQWHLVTAWQGQARRSARLMWRTASHAVLLWGGGVLLDVGGGKLLSRPRV